MMEARAISQLISQLGEGPVWNPQRNVISWVDITGQRIHSADFDSGKTQTIAVPTMVGSIVEKDGGGFLAAVKEGFASIASDGEYTLELNFLPESKRMNDGKADAMGRFWAGSTAIGFAKGEGELHVLDSDGRLRTALTGLTLPNGMGWSADNRKYYLIDSLPGILWQFDYDLESGTISDQTALIDFSGVNGIPDGLSVADNGDLYVAMWDGARIDVYSGGGDYRRSIDIPAQRPTSCTFGGPSCSTLIVTTALPEEGDSMGPFDGKIIALESLESSGPPTFRVAGR